MKNPFILMLGQQVPKNLLDKILNDFNNLSLFHTNEDCIACDIKEYCPLNVFNIDNKNLIKKIFIEDQRVMLLPPIRFKNLKKAVTFIEQNSSSLEVVLLLQLETNKLYIYKGPDEKETKTIFLPNFFELYNMLYGEDDLFLEKIIDLRIIDQYKRKMTN